MRSFAPFAVFLMVPVLLGVASHHGRKVNEARLGKIASQIAGRDVQVRCPGLIQRLLDISSNQGTVYFDENGNPANYTELNGDTCSALKDFADGKTDQEDTVRVARGLHVLAHESFHLAGVRNEAAADCYGLQRTAFVAEELGADPNEAERFAQVALVERTQSAPPEYRSTECHDGGALDLSPGSPLWP